MLHHQSDQLHTHVATLGPSMRARVATPYAIHVTLSCHSDRLVLAKKGKEVLKGAKMVRGDVENENKHEILHDRGQELKEGGV